MDQLLDQKLVVQEDYRIRMVLVQSIIRLIVCDLHGQYSAKDRKKSLPLFLSPLMLSGFEYLPWRVYRNS